MKSGKVLTALLIGAAVGGIAGILFAPDKGSETRKKIADRAGSFKDNIMDKFNELGEAIAEKYDSVRSEANEMIDKTEQKLQKDPAKNGLV